jgi:hypothetical protein
MEKEEFIESQSVSDELAEDAWEQADGDGAEASRLLSPLQQTVKGLLSNKKAEINGLFLLTWNHQDAKLTNNGGVLVPHKIDKVSVEQDHEEFIRDLRRLEESAQLLSGYTEQLENVLKNLWQESAEEFLELYESGDLDTIRERHESFLKEQLEFEELDVNLQQNVTRAIEVDSNEESDSDNQFERSSLTIPSCEVEVTPVRGVSLEALQPGDMIYVDLGDVPDKFSQLKPVLEDLRDDSDFIPVQLQKKKQTESDRYELEVQFGQNVFGTATCGRDLSILVPEATREKYGTDNMSAAGDFLDWKVVLIGGGILTLLVIVLVLI